MENSNSLGSVFGVSRKIPKTYVERSSVDDRFINDLTRYKHIVIHGSSKQGKTCLRKYHLNESDYEVIQCTRNTSKEDIYGTLLKFADIGISDVKTTKNEKGNKVKVTLGAEGAIPFVAKLKGGTDLETENRISSEKETRSFNLDITNPNDICKALKLANFNKYIVLEDFHYLPNGIQESLSYDLKAFHDNSDYIFIIIGVWLESNKLILFNGDLSGRINAITADDWSKKDLIKIISDGESLLNIKINNNAVEEIVKCCYGNVGLFQELVYRLCEEYKIWNTQEELKSIGTPIEVHAVLDLISREDAPRYINFIRSFCDETKKSELNITKWLMKYIVTRDKKKLSKVIHLDDVYHYLRKHHPYGFKITRGAITQIFSRVDKIQNKYKIQPIILEHSQRMLRVMDVNFMVFLSTHYSQEINEMLGEEST